MRSENETGDDLEELVFGDTFAQLRAKGLKNRKPDKKSLEAT